MEQNASSTKLNQYTVKENRAKKEKCLRARLLRANYEIITGRREYGCRPNGTLFADWSLLREYRVNIIIKIFYTYLLHKNYVSR